MSQNLYFYDLETSGFSSRDARVMQFAGQRTDMLLKPVSKPDNFLIKMSDDVLPDPDAVLITGITPQQTIAEGISEAEFLKIFHQDIALPGTIFTGFNTVRFDDEFMRFMHYRNFYDAYEWQWRDGRSRWDLLDVVRMTRALRPKGIKWPFDSEGRPANRLELLTSVNKISHDNAHDALADVKATIELAKLIRSKQPKLFDYLLNMRDKKIVKAFVNGGEAFVYTSGKYSSEWEKTTVVAVVCEHPDQGVVVFDLRFDPADFSKLNTTQLAEAWTRRWDDEGMKLPAKTLKYNRCPAVAPLSVLDQDSKKRLKIEELAIQKNLANLKSSGLDQKIPKVIEMLSKQRQTMLLESQADVDSRLYENFIANQDKQMMSRVVLASSDELTEIEAQFKDDRLNALLPLYKARNYSKTLSAQEREEWERFRTRRLTLGKENSRAAKFFKRLGELAQDKRLSDRDRYLLEELQLYGQSILPIEG